MNTRTDFVADHVQRSVTDGDDRFGELDEPLSEDRTTESSNESAPSVDTPETETPTTTVPTASVPSTRAEELEERAADVDPQLKALFWKLVLLYKLGLIGLAVGAVLVFLGDYPTRGSLLVAGSVALLLYAVVQTRQGKARLDAGEFDLDTDEEDDPTERTDDQSEEVSQ